MRFAKALIFYPLLFLRGLVLAIGRLVTGFFMLAFIGISIAKLAGEFPDTSWIIIFVLFVVGIGTFVLTHWYDLLLLKLNPTGEDLILIR